MRDLLFDVLSPNRNQPSSAGGRNRPNSCRRSAGRTWLFWVGWLGGGVLLAQSPVRIEPPSNLVELRARVTAHLAQARFQAAQWGVAVVSLDTGASLFAHNSDKLFMPASNAKLYTGALALDQLGPDFRIRTSLYATGRPTRAGVLAGDLVLYGRGDPTFAARFHDGDLAKAFAPLVEPLAAAGVKRVRGDLVADESFFRGPALGSGWEWDDLQYYYGAEVSALTANDNALDVLVKPAAQAGQAATISLQPATRFLTISNQVATVPVGTRRELHFYRPPNANVLFVSGQIPAGDAGYTEAVAIHRPAAWFGQLLKATLRQRGISVGGRVRAAGWPERVETSLDPGKWVELAAAESPPVRELLGRMLKPSQNLYAQLLLLQVGAAELAASTNANTARSQTTEAAGLQALDRFLGQTGIQPGEVLLEEGSGLSRRDLVTPAATLKLLQFMHRHRWAEVFRAALPLAGVDGTLKNRMKGTPAAGNVRAKTGTLSYVFALSGYVTTAAQEKLAFAIFLNNFRNPDPNRSARADLDAIAVMLAGLTWHSRTATE